MFDFSLRRHAVSLITRYRGTIECVALAGRMFGRGAVLAVFEPDGSLFGTPIYCTRGAWAKNPPPGFEADQAAIGMIDSYDTDREYELVITFAMPGDRAGYVFFITMPYRAAARVTPSA